MGRKPLTVEEEIARSLERLGLTVAPEIAQQLGVAQEQSRNAEAVVEWVANPKKFSHRLCKVCHKQFLVNYPSVAMCSDSCRKQHLRSIGIQWDPTKSPEERWLPADVPLVVPPAALRLLIAAAQEAQSSDALPQ